ncbi:MAG TPA: type 4a pilus biogenesis protein PilO [Candidatus Acidoferrales bacterium]|nr:type 4a pilus biogenesis protein PilO [Candidatus Acidoferrales bacterium]
MATSFREMPWYVQVLLFFLLAVVIVAAGEWVPMSPVKTARDNLAQLNQQQATLQQQVTSLEVYRRRYSEFKAETEAAQKQLDTLQAIVPEDKDLDNFIKMVQGAAQGSGIEIRKMSADSVVPKDYHYEMPFEIDVDGPYFAVLDFFSRLSRLSRIINVGDLSFTGLKPGEKAPIPERPSTSVKAHMTITTFFSKPADQVTNASAKQGPGQARH